jgi:hypothetical protein
MQKGCPWGANTYVVFWLSMLSQSLFLLLCWQKKKYKLKFSTHKFLNHKFWILWGSYETCAWPYTYPMCPARANDPRYPTKALRLLVVIFSQKHWRWSHL